LTIKFTHNTEQTHEPRGRVRGRQRIFERLSYDIRSPPAALIHGQSISSPGPKAGSIRGLARTCAVPVNIQFSNNSKARSLRLSALSNRLSILPTESG